MSSLTLCNYCHYRRYLANAKRDELIVTKLAGWRGGVDIFVHPAEITIEAGAGEEGHPQYQYMRGWFMELTDHCCC